MITIKIAEQKEDIFIMKMMDRDEELCEGSITIGQACEILSISKDDDIYGYSMGKALLNLADHRNAKEVICSNENLFGLLGKLGFKKVDCIMCLALKGYFSTI